MLPAKTFHLFGVLYMLLALEAEKKAINLGLHVPWSDPRPTI
jgi:hypothetical protein